MTKNFKIESNQQLWNTYEKVQNAKGTPKGSILQYKPAFLALERTTGKSLKDVTAKELDNFIKSDIIRNTSHIRGLYLFVINNYIFPINKDVLVYLIPVEYKALVELLIA
jgi:hypothetical protein